MLDKLKNWHSGLSKIGKVAVWSTAGLLSIAAIGAANPAPQAQTPAPAAQVQAQSPKIEKKTVTETAVVPFTSSNTDDASLPQGQTTIKTTGVNGVKTLTYEITYQNGKQTNKQLIKEEVTTPAINQVVAVGTYVAPSCPNGTYVNSSGNTVCSPYSSPSTPAGATAQCVDGTYSFSQSRSGTCSHHGGVAQWL
jgi:hypothetical protein